MLHTSEEEKGEERSEEEERRGGRNKIIIIIIHTHRKILQIVHTLVPAVSMLKITIYSIEIYLFVLSRPLQVAGRTRFFKIIIFFLTEHSVEL